MSKFKSHRSIGTQYVEHGQSFDILEGDIIGPVHYKNIRSVISLKEWKRISPFFSAQELASKSTGQLFIHVPMLQAYNQLRSEALIKSHTPNSFYRDPEHNKAIGGSKRSRHMFSAVDIPRSAIPNVSNMLIRAAELGFNGFGKYNSFIHMDWRKSPTRFPRSQAKSWPNW